MEQIWINVAEPKVHWDSLNSNVDIITSKQNPSKNLAKHKKF